MKLSQNFTKTSKNSLSGEVSENAKLLIRSGYIHKTMAGSYSYLPLGLRAINNIENIVRKHLNKIGGQEILMSSLSPKENWEKTNRWKEIPEYFCLPSQSGAEYRLNPTHEEVISPIAANYISSYKDLPEYKEGNGQMPLAIYQIQTKFRDELRAKSGLMRGREFRMKDMYDFHQSKESQESYFELVTQTYHDIFAEIGLKSYSVNASGGVFSEKMSREFQAICPAGEDWVYIDPENDSIAFNQEVAPAIAPESDIKTIKSQYWQDEAGNLIETIIRSDRNISGEKLQKMHKKTLELVNKEINVEKAKITQIYYDDSILEKKDKLYDIKEAIPGDINPETGNIYRVERGAEIGNIFDLGQKWVKTFEISYLDKNGKKQHPFMGCHGIGTSRCLGALAEIYCDEKGLKLPKSIAPYQVHLITHLNKKDENEINEKLLEIAQNIYCGKVKIVNGTGSGWQLLDTTDSNQLYQFSLSNKDFSIEEMFQSDQVLWDDRAGKISLGEKLSDADLIGMPFQVILTKKSLENNQVEMIIRETGEKLFLKMN